MVNRTRSARPSGPVFRISADRTPDAHCGYALKSAITAMMTGRGASIVMVELVLSAILGAYLAPARLPLQYVRGAARPEVADVDALRVADRQLADERLVHVAEEKVTRLSQVHGLQQRLAPALHPLRYRVEEQLGHIGRD